MKRFYYLYLCLILAPHLKSQPIKEAVFACLHEIEIKSPLQLETNNSEWMRAILTNVLQENGKTILLSDSLNVLVLKYEIETLEMHEIGKNMYRLSLLMPLQLKNKQEVLQEKRCFTQLERSVTKKELSQMKQEFPAIQWKNKASRWQKVFQPALISVATALGTWLFFSVRK